MTALDAVAAYLAEYRAEAATPLGRAIGPIRTGATAMLAPALANCISVVLSLARVSTAQANMLRGLADENAALRARVEKLEAAPKPRRGPFDGFM